MESSAPVVYPIPPLPNKRDHGAIGADLIVTYHSDLAQCEILPAGLRYTNGGNFKAGTFLPFNQPSFVPDLYPRLLSTEDGESSGIPLLLSMFNAEARAATLEDDWEGKWFTIVARLCPNKLTFHGIRLEGWETEETQSVQVALALPRDGGLTPYITPSLLPLSVLTDRSIAPRLLAGDKDALWPISSAHVSLAGPVDLDSFHIKEGIWSEPLTKTSVFVKLGSYLLPENDRPPHKGVHVCHVLLLFPLEQQPWSSILGWMQKAAKPFTRGSWIVCSGRVLGVLNRELIQGHQVVDSTVRILVVLPDNWEFVRQSALAANSALTPSSNPTNGLSTPPRPARPGGIASRNPFSSPEYRPTFSAQKTAVSTTLTPKHPDGKATESPASIVDSNICTTPAISSLASNSTDRSSGTDLLPDNSITVLRKRREPSPLESRSKRTTADKKKAGLYD